MIILLNNNPQKENTELRQELAERSKSADKLALKTAFDQAYTDFDTQCRAVSARVLHFQIFVN